ncbi:hypothetical protein [Legionella sp. W05-934-2]|uniref:hypothetical protein n=1 Tax=Legionella sp. W05-934-2 TaxID=1198649 RepID=UPI0034633D27
MKNKTILTGLFLILLSGLGVDTSFAFETEGLLGFLDQNTSNLQVISDGVVSNQTPRKRRFNDACQPGDAYLLIGDLTNSGTATFKNPNSFAIWNISLYLGSTFNHVTINGGQRACPSDRIAAKGSCVVTFTTDGVTAAGPERVVMEGKKPVTDELIYGYLCLETGSP